MRGKSAKILGQEPGANIVDVTFEAAEGRVIAAARVNVGAGSATKFIFGNGLHVAVKKYPCVGSVFVDFCIFSDGGEWECEECLSHALSCFVFSEISLQRLAL